eukprot:TRINITY_DN7190_c0_g2_i1.p1 TRINITY_DN7190_c0_g2~~TRINITY_DN7190_c0_g2_i1.p1  ORF type:complete len:135 (-),score=39.21 TRINITY_DN7190_c0_g2_i1:156-515(-)
MQEESKWSHGDVVREVYHEAAGSAGRFVLYIGGQAASYVEFTGNLKHSTLLDLPHTYTNPSFRGKGLAEKVVTAAFEWAVQYNESHPDGRVKLIPSCSYISDTFLAKHNEYSSIAATDL